MLLSIARAGREIGEWAEEDVRSLYQDGQLIGTDYYWHEGMTEWQPLRNLMKPLVPAILTVEGDDARVDLVQAALPSFPAPVSTTKAGRNWKAESLGCLRLLAGFLFCSVAYALTKTYLLDKPDLVTGIFYGALAGFACGLAPMIVARWKGKPWRRYFLMCGGGGAVGGLILALPLAIAFTVYLATRKRGGGS